MTLPRGMGRWWLEWTEDELETNAQGIGVTPFGTLVVCR